MKKFLKAFLCMVMVACVIQIQPVHAEEPFTNTEYWNGYCAVAANSITDSCERYRTYLRDSSSSLAEDLKNIEAKKAQYQADIAAYKDQIAQTQADIDAVQVQINETQAKIDALQVEIDAKQVEIDNKQKEIEETQVKIDEVTKKIKNRMVAKQSSLRINQYLDILMGAATLTDFMRILTGLKAINESDQSANDELVSLKEQLNTQKSELVTAQDQLKVTQDEQEQQKASQVEQQGKLIVLQADIQAAKDAAEAESAKLEAEGARISSNISSIQSTLQSIAAQYGGVIVSDGWTYPVAGSYRSAGTWNYPGGGIHLGYDFAVSIGQSVRAVGNGVVINSVNGCPVGYLGSTCGSQYGGSTGGGNQIYMLTAINGNLYAVKYLHLLLNTPIPTGTRVNAGDVIGKVGSSGNSSGAHCHIEITYLGDASLFTTYLSTWNGDLSFGAGWAGEYDGYGRRCEAGYDAPCRIRPESVFGS